GFIGLVLMIAREDECVGIEVREPASHEPVEEHPSPAPLCFDQHPDAEPGGADAVDPGALAAMPSRQMSELVRDHALKLRRRGCPHQSEPELEVVVVPTERPEPRNLGQRRVAVFGQPNPMYTRRTKLTSQRLDQREEVWRILTPQAHALR